VSDSLVRSFFSHPSGIGLCFGCQDLGRCRLGVTCERLLPDGTAELEITCPRDQQGGPEVAHGGWTASVLDEALGHLPLLNGVFAVTAELSVAYRRPVPVERPLLARSRVERREGSRWYLSGELILAAGGAVLAEATGVWVVRDREHFVRHEQWLAGQDN
jgi:acyl-coenzyme A thioesterase PaaI-like protein